jgi:3D (Asp-Asp-Asp) domain-containing protein
MKKQTSASKPSSKNTWGTTSWYPSEQLGLSRTSSTQSQGLSRGVRDVFGFGKPIGASTETQNVGRKPTTYSETAFQLPFDHPKAGRGDSRPPKKQTIAFFVSLVALLFYPSFATTKESIPVEAVKQVKRPRAVKHRLTVYYPGEDQWTSKCQSSSGYTLKNGVSIATDQKLYDYGDKVFIEGLGERIVHDTGTAVRERRASGGRYPIIDVFFKSKSEAIRFSNQVKYANVYLVDNK